MFKRKVKVGWLLGFGVEQSYVLDGISEGI